jgi:hypothetical protein
MLNLPKYFNGFIDLQKTPLDLVRRILSVLQTEHKSTLLYNTIRKIRAS